MKRLGILLVLLCGVLAPATHAGDLFKDVPPEKFAAAGLHKLTAAEMAELESLIGALRAAASTGDATEQRTGPGWLRALITLQEVAAKPGAVEAIESQLEGELTGWSGSTRFRLKNGQIWQQNDASSRYDSPRNEPKVKIYPGMLGVYWMEFEGVNQRVKVKPLKLQ